MDEKKPITKFSDSEFWELIKDDPSAEEAYKSEVTKLCSQRLYSENQLIELITGNTRNEINNYYSIPQLMRLSWALDFLTDNPFGNMYINRLAEKRRKK